MRGYRRSSASTTRRAWRYAALGLGATLTLVFGFVADDRAGSPSVIAVGSGPMAIALTPDGATAYVVTYDSTVVPVSLAAGTTGRPIPISKDASSIAITRREPRPTSPTSTATA